MEDNKKVTLYCFIYEIKDNQMCRQEDEAEPYKDAYFIHDENDETIYVEGWKIDKPQSSERTDHPFVYMYSLDKNIHRAMALISQSFKESLEDAKKKHEWMQNLVNTFEEKRECVKNKYSSEE